MKFTGKLFGIAALALAATVAAASFAHAAPADTSASSTLPDRAAVPLRTPSFVTPVEAAGTGLAPEVTVRIRIDSRGRVGGVRIVAIRPSGEFDDAFAAATRVTLDGWRFAPAIREGQQVETELEWTIQFVPRASVSRDPMRVGVADSPAAEEQRRSDRWQEILTMPPDRRSALLEEVATVAREFLVPAKTRTYASRRFLVYTDAESPRAAAEIATALESTWDTLDGLFEEACPLREEEGQIVAFVYGSRQAFRQLVDRGAGVEWLAGFYNPAGVLAFHLEQTTDQSLSTLMLHEATHAWVDRRLVRRGVFLPRWLGEGFAEYVGNSVVKNGGLIPGKTPRAQIYRTYFGDTFLGRSDAAITADEVMRRLRVNPALGLDLTFDAGPATFYGEDRETFYALSWLLVHFLRHGREGWADNQFGEFLLYAAEGYPVREAFESVYGDRPAAFDAEFRRYVARF